MGITTKALAQPKAVVGDAVWSVENLPQLSSLFGHKSQQKLMHDAQTLFHSNPWVGAVERTIVGAFLRLPWHLELPDGETVGEEQRRADSRLEIAMRLLEVPNRLTPHNTRRKLWGVTLRHQGLAGSGFWYLDQREFSTGLPLETLYINPARMESVTDEAGNLLGWLLDGPTNPVSGNPGRNGVPLTIEEVVPFQLDPPDAGHFGVGIPESANRKIELSRLADHHIGQLLASGGRLTGIMAPKQGETMDPDQWNAVLKGWRNIVNDPDSAKRLHIVKGPVDFTPTSMKPADMELNDLSRMGRDDILGTWRVPLSQIGAEVKTGLSSGERTKYDEAALYQGPVQDRGEAFRESVQMGLLDRFASIGLQLKLVIEWPTFDDQQPLFENAARARVVPMTIDQRREMVGLDPLDPSLYGEFGQAIFIDQTMVRVDPNATEPSNDNPFEPVPPKASLDRLHGVGDRLRGATEPKLRTAVASLLEEQRTAIAALVEKQADLIARKPTDSTVWWLPDQWTKAWSERVEPIVAELARRTVGEVRKALVPAKADIDFLDGVTAYLRHHLLDRARGIDTTTRQAVAKIVNQGVIDGLSPAELGRSIRESTAFDEARAEMIARTETAIAQNAAALRTYGDFGVFEVEAIDGDEDAECAARHGKVYPINEAQGITDHPNGTLDWIPVVDERPVATAKAMVPDNGTQTQITT